MINNPHAIKRTVQQSATQKQVQFMRVQSDAAVQWVDDQRKATKFSCAVAGAMAYTLNQEHARTMVGPSYAAVKV